MARRNKRASMREGPLADLFRSTEEPDDPPEPRRAPSRGASASASAGAGRCRARAEPEAPEPAAPASDDPAPVSRPAKDRLRDVFSSDAERSRARLRALGAVAGSRPPRPPRSTIR